MYAIRHVCSLFLLVRSFYAMRFLYSTVALVCFEPKIEEISPLVFCLHTCVHCVKSFSLFVYGFRFVLSRFLLQRTIPTRNIYSLPLLFPNGSLSVCMHFVFVKENRDSHTYHTHQNEACVYRKILLLFHSFECLREMTHSKSVLTVSGMVHRSTIAMLL